jgi:hypothetical protein
MMDPAISCHLTNAATGFDDACTLQHYCTCVDAIGD